MLTRNVEPGDTVQPGKTLLVLAPEAETELTVQIDEKNLRWLALGQPAQVSADAWPDRNFPAQINYIGPAVDPLRGSVEVRLLVPQPPAYLKEDMTVSIDITTGTNDKALLLPLEGVRGTPGDYWVLVIRDGVAVRQSVQLGLRNAAQQEILDGLAAGESVVASSETGIAAGDRVRARH